MTRKSIDCRDHPSESHCSVALSADTEEELLEAAAQHAVAVHGYQDGPELRSQLRSMIHEGDASQHHAEHGGGHMAAHGAVGSPDDPNWAH